MASGPMENGLPLRAPMLSERCPITGKGKRHMTPIDYLKAMGGALLFIIAFYSYALLLYAFAG